MTNTPSPCPMDLPGDTYGEDDLPAAPDGWEWIYFAPDVFDEHEGGTWKTFPIGSLR